MDASILYSNLMPKPLHLRLPATSANLGPGFDALGLAMALYLTIEATESDTDTITATGRNPELTADAERSLIFTTYREVLAQQGIEAPKLHLKLDNGIPLGMGCGSSAAALLAGVHLAKHFGELNWTPHQIMTEACLREGHPDNVAACALGGMTASSQQGTEILTATLGLDLDWRLLLALPSASLATEKARALLPDTYSRADAVANIQRSSLLVAAFALNRPDLLRTAMQDRIHQPYRSEACPLLPRLLPLATHSGIHGVALSGAGPSVLLVVDPTFPLESVSSQVREAAHDPSMEMLYTTIAGPTLVTV
jgi:homoserine kinase